MTHQIQIDGQEFILHPLGGVFWVDRSILLISDVHLGKVGHFRKFGAAVPRKAVHRNFMDLDTIAGHFNPFHICFLGDLFHSSMNKEWGLFENWVAKTPAKLSLVIGNHDIIAREKFESLQIELFESLELDGFLFTHHPEIRDGFFNFCRHIHPAIRLQGHGRQRLKLSCFFKTKGQMILPAFGEFTGNHTLTPKASDDIFVIAEGEVVAI